MYRSDIQPGASGGVDVVPLCPLDMHPPKAPQSHEAGSNLLNSNLITVDF